MTAVAKLGLLDLQPQSVEIIVYGRDTVDEMKACLKSLRALAPPRPTRIVLADSGSSARNLARLSDLASKESLTFLANQSSTGTAAIIRNAFSTRGDAEFVVLIAAEVTVPPNFLRNLTRPMSDSLDVGLVGPLSNFATWQSIPRVRAPNRKWQNNKLPRGMKLPDFEETLREVWLEDPVVPRVPLLNGFCVAIRGSALDRIGGPDEALHWGHGGDIDFCFRAADVGVGMVIAANAFAYRDHAQRSDPQREARRAREGDEALANRYGGRAERAANTMSRNPILDRIRERTADIASVARHTKRIANHSEARPSLD